MWPVPAVGPNGPVCARRRLSSHMARGYKLGVSGFRDPKPFNPQRWSGCRHEWACLAPLSESSAPSVHDKAPEREGGREEQVPSFAANRCQRQCICRTQPRFRRPSELSQLPSRRSPSWGGLPAAGSITPPTPKGHPSYLFYHLWIAYHLHTYSPLTYASYCVALPPFLSFPFPSHGACAWCPRCARTATATRCVAL